MDSAVLRIYYDKADKVIDSCTNCIHLDGARNYINNFFSSLGTVEYFTPKVVTASNEITNYYSQLIDKLEKKEKEFNCE